jgi:hypothetical protein
MTAEAIIFAINSAIKLGSNAQQAYVERVREKELSLPPPRVDFEPTLMEMHGFFDQPENAIFLEENEGLRKLHEKAGKKPPKLSDDELGKYRGIYGGLRSGYEGLSADAVTALFRLDYAKKSKKGKATVLQAVAGTLVESGIDYFKLMPGLLNPDSVRGRLMHKFLGAFDGISLADNPELKKDLSNKLVPRLFGAAAESVASLSTQIAADEKVQDFIQAAALGIAEDIYQRAAQSQLDGAQEDEAVRWGQLVLRSMVQNAGHYVLASPQAFFGTNAAASQLIESSGRALLDAILDDDSGSLNLRNALSQDSLDQIARAALSVVAEHPNLVSGRAGLKEIIGGVAAAVKDDQLLFKGCLPELARIVLEQSAGRLELLWRETPSGPEHLLVVALHQVLGVLSEKPEEGPWQPLFTKSNLLGVMEELMDEVAHNPAWIMDEVRGQSVMAEVLEATFSALHALPKGERLQPQTLRQVIQLGLRVTLASPQVLDKVSWGTESEEAAILSKALELVFTYTFPPDAPPSVSRLGLMAELLEYTTDVVLRQYPDKRGLMFLHLLLSGQNGMDYAQGFQPALAKQLAEAAFAVLAQHPDLVAHDQVLQRLVADLAEAVQASGLQRAGLLPGLIGLTLEHSAGYLEMLWDVEQPQSKHLLALAAAQVLRALAQLEASGERRLQLSDPQVLEIAGLVYQAILANPRWARQEGLILRLLQAVFFALREAPEELAVTYALLRDLIGQAIAAADRQRALLAFFQVPDGAEKLLLQYALERLLDLLFRGDYTVAEDVWYLSQAPVLKIVIEHYLGYLTGTPFKEEQLQQADGQIKMALAMWKAGFSQDLGEVLDKLRYLFLNPPGMEEGQSPWLPTANKPAG